MNKTKIEWCDSTWNPVTGCLHGCEYCYARKIAERFGGMEPGMPKHRTGRNNVLYMPLCKETKDGKSLAAPYPFGFDPTFHRHRLVEPNRKAIPQTIFVCSMADLFGNWVPDDWIEDVFAACKSAPQHRYLFLTKNPVRYIRLSAAGKLPEDDNFWYGSTMTTQEDMYWWSERHNTFISIEPLLEQINLNADLQEHKVDWAIIGVMTGPGSKEHRPEREWIEDLAQDAKNTGIPVLMKNSVVPIVGEGNMLREFPWTQRTEEAQRR